MFLTILLTTCVFILLNLTFYHYYLTRSSKPNKKKILPEIKFIGLKKCNYFPYLLWRTFPKIMLNAAQKANSAIGVFQRNCLKFRTRSFS